MNTKLNIYQGNEIDLPSSFEEGSVYVCVDTENVYADLNGERVKLTQLAKTQDGGYSLFDTGFAQTHSAILGYACKAQAHGFTILNIDKEERKYQLDSVEGLEIGDVCSSCLRYVDTSGVDIKNEILCEYGKIIEIDAQNKTITLDNIHWPETAMQLDILSTYLDDYGVETDENSLFIFNKPYAGSRKLSTYGFASGKDNLVLSSGCAAFGGQNLVGGSWSFSANSDNVVKGWCSAAFGNNNLISAHNSFVVGYKNKIYNGCSMAEGSENTVNGKYCHAEGLWNIVNGFGNHVEGRANNVQGEYSHVGGTDNLLDGNQCLLNGKQNNVQGNFNVSAGSINTLVANNSVAFGQNNSVSSDFCLVSGQANIIEQGASQSVAFGYSNHIYKSNSFAAGYGNTIDNKYAVALGQNNSVKSQAGLAIGSDNTVAGGGYNVALGCGLIANRTNNGGIVVGKYNQEDTAAMFMIGGGASASSRNTLLSVDAKGNLKTDGTVSGGGADYAEYFEWVDGNKNSEDRRGRFVTLIEDKIKYAVNGEDILGIVSADPTVVGNEQSLNWQGRFLKDQFGATLYEEYETEDGVIDTRPVENPEYDSEMQYIPRSQRPEWSPIGFMGQIIMLHDGTCAVGGYCAPGVDGIATSSSEKTNCRVMKVIDETHILVLLK